MMLGIAFVMLAYAIIAVWNAIQITAIVDPKAEFVETRFLKFFLSLAGWLTFFAGTALLAQPETSGSLLSRRRGVARILLLSTILYIGFGIVPKSYFWDFAKDNGVFAKIVVASIALVVSQSVLWILLRRIIDRTPRRELSRLLTIAFWLSLPVNLLLCEGSFTLLDGMKNHDRFILLATLGLRGLGLLKCIAAIVLLVLTRKGIRRTVGYWDN